jgi:hypothetical protein
MRRYLTILFLAPLVLTPCLAGVNWLIDPYKLWNPPDIGINAVKSELGFNERIFKTAGLAKKPADVVILGTSRSDVGLNPGHESIGANGLNLAISSQPYRETRMLFETLADNSKPVKTFIIGLDFFAANALYPDPADFTAENYSAHRKWRLLISISTLRDSMLTVLKRNMVPDDNWTENGRHFWSPGNIKSRGGHRKWMRDSEKSYYQRQYSPEPVCAFELAPPNSKPSPIEEIRPILSRAYRERIGVKLFISPSHARQWETLAASGLWDKWEKWKRLLVKMNEEEALRAGRQPFALWDFSGYNSISTETAPAPGDTATTMKWYFDSSHYNTAAGDLTLDRIFGFKSPLRSVPDDFGALLTSANIDAHLARIRAERQRYRNAHPEDVAEIETMVREVAKTKHCLPAKPG